MGRYVMSAAHTWFGRSIVHVAQQIGTEILWPGAGFVVFGFGPSAAMPILRINCCTRLRLTASPSASASRSFAASPGMARR
ncbi:bsl1967 [Bradyrhizobium diazoefficiens USDA 110]|jgi:hypothetical protein|uniref:Bsl1967 protein n=3 Tax=Bradyrhizobium TaxID=374 RepID=Q89TI2_BRADU|nr:hypothetical protein RN69_38240 [Bradyrhizobium japonicum]AND87530.1 hypothetical protein AAV28_06710 [Bradyrhizobium diazoefficiens USDA 110]APO50600.1 hypothetical protein BD122_10110 [Bradyrhizobium diazoefficiens]AWL91405.1 hypothetical protein CIT37_03205 [Bradyrhizobium ottawaense]BAL13126.1 hypothetical protein BJ6T_78800 [Bradyrhizobium japonicum USDA 6]